MGVVDVIAGAGLFRDLEEEELKKVGALCREDDRGPGEMIFREGDDAEDICVVVDGQVELRFELPGRSGATNTQTISTILPGKAFGWSALVPPYKMTLSAYAGNRPCGFYRISGKALIKLFEDCPRIGYICMRNLTHVIAKRFHKMEDEVARAEGLNIMHQW